MQISQPSLFTRDDTFLGICEGIGEDVGINPLYLRLALTGLLFWNPVVGIATYLAMGVPVLLARLIYPARHRAASAPAEAQAERAAAAAEARKEEMALAA